MSLPKTFKPVVEYISGVLHSAEKTASYSLSTLYKMKIYAFSDCEIHLIVERNYSNFDKFMSFGEGLVLIKISGPAMLKTKVQSNKIFPLGFEIK